MSSDPPTPRQTDIEFCVFKAEFHPVTPEEASRPRLGRPKREYNLSPGEPDIEFVEFTSTFSPLTEEQRNRPRLGRPKRE
jgi:hypothetical protein